MSTPLADFREQAIALRRAGKSRREIKEILGVCNNDAITDALRGEPPPEWTRRPNAKDDLRAKARRLRQQGMDYNRIAAELGVSKSSISLWVRDMPRPDRLSDERCRMRHTEAMAAYWAAERARRASACDAVREGAKARLGGEFTAREMLIAGAIAYLCEGTKSKSYRRDRRVCFMNSDPRLISFFLKFLQSVDVAPERLTFRLFIHENADVAAAQDFWLKVTQADPTQFRRPTLKRHNPKTVRLNTGEQYRGCLRIDVLRSAALYLQIEGWCEAVLGLPDRGCSVPAANYADGDVRS
jgi:predicted transcriptional regulator